MGAGASVSMSHSPNSSSSSFISFTTHRATDFQVLPCSEPPCNDLQAFLLTKLHSPRGSGTKGAELHITF